MVIRQGDVYWIDMDEPSGSEPGFLHPYVVIQNNAFNWSCIQTVVVCTLTSNLKAARAPGNVLLAKGEGNLPKRSVVNISQISTVDKGRLVRRIGNLSKVRMEEVIRGIHLLLRPVELEPRP